LLLGRQDAADAQVGASTGLERFETPVAVLVQPLFQGLVSHLPGSPPVVFKRLSGQLGQQLAQLSFAKAATEHFAEDGMPKKRFFGAVIIVHGSSWIGFDDAAQHRNHGARGPEPFCVGNTGRVTLGE